MWYGLSKLIQADPSAGLALAQSSALERPRRLGLRQLASSDEGREALCVQLLASRGEAELELLEALDTALRERRGVQAPPCWAAAYSAVLQRGAEQACELGLWIAAAFQDEQAVPQLVTLVKDDEAPVERRLRALEALEATSAAGLGEVFLAALEVGPLRLRAIEALARHSHPRAAALLLRRFSELSEEEQRAALATLSARSDYATALLGALESGRLEADRLSAFVVRKLRSHEDEELADRVTALFGIERESSEEKRARIDELVAELSELDLATTRPSRGRAVFERTCAQCHTLFGEGSDLAPDLTGSNRADLEYLISNIVDPNALIGRDYQVTIVRTVDGVLVTGVLQEENEDSLVLRSETETTVVALDEIEERVLSDVSMMPEGQLETLAPGELEDLVAYLASESQVEAVTDAADAVLFDGKSLMGWDGDLSVWSVEDGELVGRTDGLAHNSFLVSEVELGDFRFSCEVLLVDDAGNSGIQFRSRAFGEGEVAGYQADIGAGWWGKLYEEHGRGPLTSEEAVVRRGEWNEYVIEAKGDRVRTWINGVLSVDLVDPDGARTGRIAPQVHSGGPTEIRLRKLSIGPPE